MRSTALFLILLVFTSFSLSQRVHGDIILSVDVGIIDPNLPYGVVDIFARSDAGDSLISLTVDFELAAGRFDVVPGIMGEDGMLGRGNINQASQFIRNSDTSASLSLDFNTAQVLDGNDVLLTSLRINARGLPDGFYAIMIVDSLADVGRVDTQITDFGHPGGFFVQAVPEPSSTFCLLIGILAIHRRRTVRSPLKN